MPPSMTLSDIKLQNGLFGINNLFPGKFCKKEKKIVPKSSKKKLSLYAFGEILPFPARPISNILHQFSIRNILHIDNQTVSSFFQYDIPNKSV